MPDDHYVAKGDLLFRIQPVRFENAVAEARKLPLRFLGPCEDHTLSDNVGVKIFQISDEYGGTHHNKIRDELGGSINTDSRPASSTTKNGSA